MRGLSWNACVALAVFCVLAQGGWIPAAWGDAIPDESSDRSQWVCRAEGTYSSCPGTRSFRPCEERRAEGLGTSVNKRAAGVEAEQSCTEEMMRMLVFENRTGIASIKSPCVIGMCDRE